jgi:hypothetical protein
MVSWPEVEIASAVSASVSAATADDSTAASLVPRMLIVTEVAVPSALVTAELSL